MGEIYQPWVKLCMTYDGIRCDILVAWYILVCGLFYSASVIDSIFV